MIRYAAENALSAGPTEEDDCRKDADVGASDDAFRATLEERYSEASASYDKTVLTLSGGALAVSLAFIKDVAPNPTLGSSRYLFLAWLSFGSSLAGILTALLFSQKAIRRAIAQIDAQTVRRGRTGGWQSTATEILNILAAVLFVLGVIMLLVFAALNLRENSSNVDREVRRQESARSAADPADSKTNPR